MRRSLSRFCRGGRGSCGRIGIYCGAYGKFVWLDGDVVSCDIVSVGHNVIKSSVAVIGENIFGLVDKINGRRLVIGRRNFNDAVQQIAEVVIVQIVAVTRKFSAFVFTVANIDSNIFVSIF